MSINIKNGNHQIHLLDAQVGVWEPLKDIQ